MLIKKNKAEFPNCNLAGFGHTEGYMLLDQMRPGDKLTMVREDENRHDPTAEQAQRLHEAFPLE